MSRLDIKNHFFTGGVVSHWDRLPRAVVDVIVISNSKKNVLLWCSGAWLRGGSVSAELMVGPDDLRDLFQYQWFSDSITGL